MAATGVDAALASLMQEQHLLEELLRQHWSPADVLEIGQAVLRFAARESAAFESLASLLDPAVQLELGAEHRQIAEDLELLKWLLQTAPTSGDVLPLTQSIGRRLQQHISRDGRLLSRALTLRQA